MTAVSHHFAVSATSTSSNELTVSFTLFVKLICVFYCSRPALLRRKLMLLLSERADVDGRDFGTCTKGNIRGAGCDFFVTVDHFLVASYKSIGYGLLLFTRTINTDAHFSHAFYLNI